MGDLDRRKHDVDVIERVLGGLRESDGPIRTIIDVELPADRQPASPTGERAVGSASDSRPPHRTTGE